MVHGLIDALARDNRSGATALTRLAAEALVAAAKDGQEALAEAAGAVTLAQPAMGGICRLASHCLEADDALAAISQFLHELESRPPLIARRAAGLLSGQATVLTLSASSLVLETLRVAHHHGWRGRVFSLESRPLREGLALAEQLAAHGVPTTLAVDAAGPRLVQEVELVLVGADTVAPAGLVHKLGTLGLALAARAAGRPVYALGGSEKRIPGLVRGALEARRDAREVLPEPRPGQEAWNSYFDVTPLRLLTGVVDEHTILTPAAATRAAASVKLHPELKRLVQSEE